MRRLGETPRCAPAIADLAAELALSIPRCSLVVVQDPRLSLLAAIWTEALAVVGRRPVFALAIPAPPKRLLAGEARSVDAHPRALAVVAVSGRQRAHSRGFPRVLCRLRAPARGLAQGRPPRGVRGWAWVGASRRLTRRRRGCVRGARSAATIVRWGHARGELNARIGARAYLLVAGAPRREDRRGRAAARMLRSAARPASVASPR